MRVSSNELFSTLKNISLTDNAFYRVGIYRTSVELVQTDSSS